MKNTVAVLVDGAFFITRFRKLHPKRAVTAAEMANEIWRVAQGHVNHDCDRLYRIFYYDCEPLSGKMYHPLLKRELDRQKSDIYKFRTALHAELKRHRKMAMRLGRLFDSGHWKVKPAFLMDCLKGKQQWKDIKPEHILRDISQKGVDMRMGIDISSIALKRLVNKIVLITGDSDFVPAAKLARREGVDVVLDPMWAHINPELYEHIDGLKNSYPHPVGVQDSTKIGHGATSSTGPQTYTVVAAKIPAQGSGVS